MPATRISRRNGHGCSARLGLQWSRLLLLAIGACFCSSLALCAQTPDFQTGDANPSSASASDWQSGNAGLMRTLESHTQSGNRTLDKQSVQRRGFDGYFEPYQDIEKETIQVDATTVQTTTRTFGRDADGIRTLMQVTEEEKHTLPGGESNLVRALSYPDGNGKLQVLQRQIEEKKTGKDSEETNTTVMYPSADGGLAPGMKVQERRNLGENGTVESQETTLLPDGGGKWQVSEIRQATTRREGKNSITEEFVSRADPEGKLGELSRTVSQESEGAHGEKHNAVAIYSADVAGSVRDGSMHLVERATSTQRISSTGLQTTQQQVEQPNPGNPDSGLRVTTLTTDTVRPGPSGAQATRTVQVRDANGGFAVFSIDTTKSDNIHSIQVQMGPPEKP
jgi:hypothetical protein